jgi:hypothetical protein
MRAVLTNESPSPLRLYTTHLGYATLVMKARDAGQKPIFPGPPPTPSADDGSGRVDLAPGERRLFEYTGTEYFQPPLAAGKYELQFRYQNRVVASGEWAGALESPWVPFEVGAAR